MGQHYIQPAWKKHSKDVLWDVHVNTGSQHIMTPITCHKVVTLESTCAVCSASIRCSAGCGFVAQLCSTNCFAIDAAEPYAQCDRQSVTVMIQVHLAKNVFESMLSYCTCSTVCLHKLCNHDPMIQVTEYHSDIIQLHAK